MGTFARGDCRRRPHNYLPARRPRAAVLRIVAGVVCAVSALAIGPAVAGASAAESMTMLSRSHTGGLPDGPSQNPAIAHDRQARFVVFESDATNLVEGDTNGHTDVFLVKRKAPFGNELAPWEFGSTQLVSVGLGGAPANGPSWGASLSGHSEQKARCVAFISEASNLVEGDTNGVADAFLHDPASGATLRVSVDSKGRQANGPTTEVSVDGECSAVAFTSEATNLVKGVKGRMRAGRKQVYLLHTYFGYRKGGTILLSATKRGKPGNGDSWQPVFAPFSTDVAFTSDASNLARGDRNSVSDVYRTDISVYLPSRSVTLKTLLISATPSGRAGNGPSSNPAIDDYGRHFAYETAASNLVAGDSNGVSDIVEAKLDDYHHKIVKQRWVSKGARSESGHPSISSYGEVVAFDSGPVSTSDETGGLRDVLRWIRDTGSLSVVSGADSPDAAAASSPTSAASSHPAVSSQGNHIAFESTATALDTPLIAQLGGVAPATDRSFIYIRSITQR